LEEIGHRSTDTSSARRQPRARERSCRGSFEKMKAKGDICKGVLRGLVRVPDETFFSTSQLKEGKCPGLRPVRGEPPGGELLLPAGVYKDRSCALPREPESSSRRTGRRDRQLRQGAQRPLRLPHQGEMGDPGAFRPGPHRVRVVRRPHQLRVRHRYDPSKDWEGQSGDFKDKWSGAVHLVRERDFPVSHGHLAGDAHVHGPAAPRKGLRPRLVDGGRREDGPSPGGTWWTRPGRPTNSGGRPAHTFFCARFPSASDGTFPGRGSSAGTTRSCQLLGNLLNRT